MAFNGLLQGVMQGVAAGATGGAEVAKGYYEDQRKVDVYKEMADIETEKQKLIEKFRSDLGVERKGKELELEDQATVKRGTNKEYLGAVKNIKAAERQPESSASVAQARLANREISKLDEIDALRKEWKTATPERQKAIREELSLLQGKSADKYTPIKDSLGNPVALMNNATGDVAPLSLPDANAPKAPQSPASKYRSQ